MRALLQGLLIHSTVLTTELEVEMLPLNVCRLVQAMQVQVPAPGQLPRKQLTLLWRRTPSLALGLPKREMTASPALGLPNRWSKSLPLGEHQQNDSFGLLQMLHEGC